MKSVNKMPSLTVDALIVHDGGLVLVRRGRPPYEGCYALPGGFVEYGETVEDAVKREALEETGLEIEILHLSGVYSDPDRDPRGHMISVCYLARSVGGSLKGGSDADEARIFDPDELPSLAFDHDKIVDNAMEDLHALLS